MHACNASLTNIWQMSLESTGTIMNKEILRVTGQKRGFAAVFDMDSNGVSEVNRSF